MNFIRLKKFLFIFLSVIIIFILSVAGYFLYVYFSYNRIVDYMNLDVDGESISEIVEVEKELSISTYNIGFGAYSQDYTFFLDSSVTFDEIENYGYYGKARDKEEVIFNTNGAIKTIIDINPDFALFQEVDIIANRSYKINQYQMIQDSFTQTSHSLGVNYDSAFLPYPFYDMHGKTLAGIATFSKYHIQEATRISLPVATDFSKFFDLDRCFVINEFNTSNNNKLIIVNIHMSAYDEGGFVRKQQIDLLNEYLYKWNELGYYVIIGGDFNHDLITYNPLYKFDFDTSIVFSEFINHKRPYWLQLFYDENHNSLIDKNYTIFASNNAPTNRDASVEWEIGKGYVCTIDGFILSKNIDVLSIETVITKNGNKGLDHFAYSDHDPALLKFKLK